MSHFGGGNACDGGALAVGFVFGLLVFLFCLLFSFAFKWSLLWGAIVWLVVAILSYPAEKRITGE